MEAVSVTENLQLKVVAAMGSQDRQGEPPLMQLEQ